MTPREALAYVQMNLLAPEDDDDDAVQEEVLHILGICVDMAADYEVG